MQFYYTLISLCINRCTHLFAYTIVIFWFQILIFFILKCLYKVRSMTVVIKLFVSMCATLVFVFVELHCFCASVDVLLKLLCFPRFCFVTRICFLSIDLLLLNSGILLFPSLYSCFIQSNDIYVKRCLIRSSQNGV